MENQTTEVSLLIRAPRATIYEAFVDGDLLAQWLAPDTMRGTVHTLEPFEGGKIRMSLTYQKVADSPDGKGGKSSADTDTFEGSIVQLIPNEKIVWVTVFESDDPDFAGEMTLIWTLADAENGTLVTVRCENIPAGIRPEDNEDGSRQSLQKLAKLVE